jgi:cellulose synthase/poly-beta-1,6-N-acetylglucosamine synthase-like glycosyltransferase
VFWASAGALAWSYAGYPLVMFLLAALRQVGRDLRFVLQRGNRRNRPADDFVPGVAMLVAAYNEEAVIEEKLRNTDALDYPAGKFEFLLGLDNPSDSTPQRARRFPHAAMRVFDFGARRGKLAVLSDLAAQTSADILAFSDANTMLEPESLRRLVRHFANPDVGAVCGELRVVSPGDHTPMESLYWRYEVALKFLENRMNCVLGANGAVYAVRRELFHMDPRWIVEDFQLPMEIRFAGRSVVYDPEALGSEEAAPTFAAEFRRKVRIGAGDYLCLFTSPHYLNPLRGLPALAYISHKVLRWLGPLFLLAALGASAWLAKGGSQIYAGAFAAQALFYLLALAGYLQERRSGKAGRLTGLAFYFTAMNLALLLGLFRFLTGQQQGVWSATPRSANSADAPTTTSVAEAKSPAQGEAP